MLKKKSKEFTALIGAGYWGTNIARNLIKLCKTKLYIYDKNKANIDILVKRFPNKFIISNNYKSLLENNSIKNFVLENLEALFTPLHKPILFSDIVYSIFFSLR